MPTFPSSRCCAALTIAVALTAGAISQAVAQSTAKPCAEPGNPNQTLSDKLDRSDGVICPPDVDANIKTPVPDAGKMPVIPPPGSPGGDPNVHPK